MDSRHPPAEVRVDTELVRRLLDAQHPKYLGAEPTLVDEGWDNFTFRIGNGHALRIPRREAAVPLIVNEQRWLPQIASWLDLSVPVPVAVGQPSPLFSWPWSVVEWIPGDTAEGTPLSPEDAESLARALRALHRTAPPEAPSNPFRGVPLRERGGPVEERLARLGLHELVPPWSRALETELADSAVWLHGDLHPRNVLVGGGGLVGLIDWGDMTAGDSATDLACAWMLFDEGGRAVFLEAYAPSEAEELRAAGWAVNFGSAMLDSGDPTHVSIGRRIVGELVGELG